jgi:EmrB/QacA subfamily drug resistance transporter
MITLESRKGRLVLVASILGSAMPFVDGTAVNVALPAMAADLGATFAGFQWILNAYLITLSALVLPGGSLVDRLGCRKTFAWGAGLFAVASVLCGVAPDQATLIVARALQGVAAALLVPASLALIQTNFVPDQRGRAVGLWSGFSGLSTVIGPLLGGWLVDAFSWRWVFYLNVPIGALAIFMVLRALEPSEGATKRGSLDKQGALLAAVALGCIVFALTQGPEWGWSHPGVMTAGILGVLTLVGFVDTERNHPDPMLPLRFFRRRGFVGANLVTVGIYFAISGNFFLLTIQMQRVLGFSAFGAGLALSPITALLLFVSPRAGRWAGIHGPRSLMIVGPTVAAAGALLLGRIGIGADYVMDILPGVIVFGLGLSLTVAPLTSASLAAVEDRYSGVAVGVNNAVARASQLLAVPLLPILAGLAGIESVGGAEFSAGFQAAERVNAIVLLASAGVAALVLRPGLFSPED